MPEKTDDKKKRGRSSSSSSSSSSGSSSSGSSSSGSRSSSSSSSSRSRSPRRRENRPAAGRNRTRSRSPIRRGSPARARPDRGDRNDRDRPRRSPSPRRRRSPSPRRDRRDRSGSPAFRRRSPRRSSPAAARSASPPKRVVIKNLSKNVLRAHLEEIFSIYGTIKNVDLPNDRFHQHIHRGYGYVDYESQDDAAKSVKYMDGGQIDGLIVQVELTIGRGVQERGDRGVHHPIRKFSPIRRNMSPIGGGGRKSSPPPRRGGNYNRSPPPRRRSPPGGARGSGANQMPLGPSRFRRNSRSRSPIGNRGRSRS